MLSWGIINGRRAKPSRKTMRERVPTFQHSKKGHQKWVASPPSLRAGFSGFGGVEHAFLWFVSKSSDAGHYFFLTTLSWRWLANKFACFAKGRSALVNQSCLLTRKTPSPRFTRNLSSFRLSNISPAPDVSRASEASRRRSSFGNSRQAGKKK